MTASAEVIKAFAEQPDGFAAACALLRVGMGTIEPVDLERRLFQPAEQGRAMLLLPVPAGADPASEPVDVVAFDPARPHIWWRRHGLGDVLGTRPLDGRGQVRLYATPWEWLLGAARDLAASGAVSGRTLQRWRPTHGLCVLDPERADWLEILSPASRVACDRPGYADWVRDRVKAQRRAELGRMPKFVGVESGR